MSEGLNGRNLSDRRGPGGIVRSLQSFMTALYRIGIPVALWIVFVNAARHFHARVDRKDAAMREAVEAELASRRCPGVRLDLAGFRKLAHERGINHADIYQPRSIRLQKAAALLDRELHDDPQGACQRLLDRYGGSDLHLLNRF